MRNPSFLEIGFAMRPLAVVRNSVLVSLAAVVGACGNSGPPTKGGGFVGTRSVIASAADCSSFGPDVLEGCAKAIEGAVSRHERSPDHTRLEDCEKASGPGLCERSASGKYRPRLSAFLVTQADALRAEPLYPAGKGAVGFQTADKTVLGVNDGGLAFSRLALSVAEGQAETQKKKRR